MTDCDYAAWADDLRDKYGIAYPLDTSDDDDSTD